MKFKGELNTARINMQIDIGFGDVVYPKPDRVELPALLDFPGPRLLGYSRESMIAEKFEAMVKLGELNSRMKDFFDMWTMSRLFDFKGDRLSEAIRRTFERRGTLFTHAPAAFTDSFAVQKQVQWTAFQKRFRSQNAPESLLDVINTIEQFLAPPSMAIESGSSFGAFWIAPGPWIIQPE